MNPTPRHLEQVKSLWDLKDQLQFIRKVENWIYSSKNDKVFVRLTELSHRNVGQIQSELHWVDHLKNHGVRFAHPVKSINQVYVETIDCDGTPFAAAVFREAEGRALVTASDFTQTRMENWGRIIGQMHAATKSYVCPRAISPRVHWTEDRTYLCPKNSVNKKDRKLFDRFQDMDAWMRTLPRNPDHYGLIHSDLHRGNFFVNMQDEITVFDFDDSHYHWFSYDIAVPISSLSWDLVRWNSELKWEEFNDSFWKGYLSANHLSDEWIKVVPRFIEYRNFVVYYHCVSNLKRESLDPTSRDWMEKTVIYCRSEIEKLS